MFFFCMKRSFFEMTLSQVMLPPAVWRTSHTLIIKKHKPITPRTHSPHSPAPHPQTTRIPNHNNHTHNTCNEHRTPTYSKTQTYHTTHQAPTTRTYPGSWSRSSTRMRAPWSSTQARLLAPLPFRPLTQDHRRRFRARRPSCPLLRRSWRCGWCTVGAHEATCGNWPGGSRFDFIRVTITLSRKFAARIVLRINSPMFFQTAGCRSRISSDFFRADSTHESHASQTTTSTHTEHIKQTSHTRSNTS